MFETTDFNEWLSLGNLPSDHKKAAALVVAASGNSAKPYKVTWPGSMKIKGPTGDSLLLYSERSRAAFRSIATSHLKRFERELAAAAMAEDLILKLNGQSRSEWQGGWRSDWAKAA
jgi:hypothetical protein